MAYLSYPINLYLLLFSFPASKFFDDGNNIHLCLKTQDKWLNIVADFKNKYPEINQYVHFND